MMTTALATTETERHLQGIARDIDREFKGVMYGAQTTMEHALMLGIHLIDAKQLVGHGQWESWVTANTQLSVRSAQKYMRLARRQNELPDSYGINDGIAHLAEVDRVAGEGDDPLEVNDQAVLDEWDRRWGKPTEVIDNDKPKSAPKGAFDGVPTTVNVKVVPVPDRKCDLEVPVERTLSFRPVPGAEADIVEDVEDAVDTVEDIPQSVRGVGVRQANAAIDLLKAIPRDDELRKVGFKMVLNFIRANT